MLIQLPIDQYVDQIVKDCQDYPTILVKASPGSGKTTRLPWAIAKKFSGKVLVLEPRRLAAKLAAERIASENGLVIGEEVGYHFRMEKKTSSSSRLIFHTEGTFLKKLIDDSDLAGVDAVILDEVHERHLDTDLSLAYLRSLQKKRKNLKLILMSATLDTSLEKKFENPKLWEINARNFDVTLSYLPNQPSILNQSLEKKVNAALRDSYSESGHVLVFLPGMREMLKVQEAIGARYGEVFILHSEISKAEQDRAIQEGGKRKIILSTNIAESSLTIPGVTVVIDSGLQREASYSPWNGLKFLLDKKVTKSSAVQRAGRAGRTENGTCLRLYSQQDFDSREEATIPEIERADLTDTYLLGKKLKLEFDWIEPPPQAKWEGARLLCERLGAVSENGELTVMGEAMLNYPLDARLSRILVEGEKLPQSEKKKLLSYISDVIEDDRSGMLKRRLNFYLLKDGQDPKSFEQCLLSGFIDQVARFRSKQHDFVHYSGKSFKAHPSLHQLLDGFYIVLDITQRQEVMKVLEVDESWFYDLNPFPLTEDQELVLDSGFKMSAFVKLGSLVLEAENKNLDFADLKGKIKEKIIVLSARPFTDQWINFQQGSEYARLHFWGKHQNLLLTDLSSKISFLDYAENYQTLKFDQLDEYFTQKINEYLGNPNLKQELPVSLDLGGKKPLEITYSLSEDPFVEAPIQDFYGKASLPQLLGGKIPLTIKLIGPGRQPIQVTKDLKGFWEKMYKELKKEYSRDYPRHYWPDDPLTAKPILLKRMLPPV